MIDPIGPTLPISDTLHAMKYRGPGESFREAMNRIAAALKDDDAHFHAFQDILYQMRFMPAGRVQSAMGSPKRVTPYNCFMSGPVLDTFTGPGGIMQRATEAAETMRMGGGIGYCFSEIRPRGDPIESVQSQASGPVSFMQIFDAVCKTVASSGHRRGAQMGVLRCDHNDIEEFIHAKQNATALTAFNISVGITDKFMIAVESGDDFDLMWKGKARRSIDARALWEAIMRSTWDWAEPGVLFLDTINRMNNLSYVENISGTNPCCVTGETPILTRRGYIPIAEVEGQEVEVWNGEEWSTVSPYYAGHDRILRVELSNGVELLCSPSHRFLSKEGEMITTENAEGVCLAKTEMPVVDVDTDAEIDPYSQGFYSGDGFTDKDRSWVYWPKYPCIDRLSGTIGKEHPIRRFRTWYHGKMLPKNWVPVNQRQHYKINWFTGLLDADGCVVRNPHSDGLQITSVDRKFLADTRLMLTTLGVQGHLASMHQDRTAAMPDGKGGLKDYECKAVWRLSINCTDTQTLLQLGLVPSRLKIREGEVQRDARRFITVVSVEDTGQEAPVYCFTEPKRGLGVFNGILTGNSEQPLPAFGACLLGSFNLVKYIKHNYESEGYRFDYAQLHDDIPHVVRAMDNVIDNAIYPLVEQKEEALSKRRMGLGVTGAANAGEALGFPYGSEGFLLWLNNVLSAIAQDCYKASVELAREKGPFPLFDRQYLASPTLNMLPQEITHSIAEDGIRNSHLLSIAPTGTISLCADNVSSGIEPVYGHNVTRTIQTFDGVLTAEIDDYGVREFGVKGKTAAQCTADDHLNVLIASYKHTDSAVSKTVNVNPNMPWDDFKQIYMRAWEEGCKGCATFNPKGKRMGILEDNTCYTDPETGVKDCGD